MFKRTMMLALLVGLVGFAFTTAVIAGDAPARIGINGQLTKIDGKTLTITTTVDKETKETVITCDDATKISRKGAASGAQAKFEDLQVGQPVRAYYTEADNVAVAVIILVPPADAPVRVGITGQLTKIDGKTLSITQGKGTKNTVITCNDATQISRKGDKSGAPAKFEDLQAGQAVRAYYTKADNVAVAVIIIPEAPAPAVEEKPAP